MPKGSTDSRSTCVGRYLQEISEFPLLTKEEEQAIALRMLGSSEETSYHDLVKSNLSFVVKIASEYRNMGLPFEDLLNEGNIGLIEAAHHFDHTRGTKFITYAIWWIRKSILKALSQHSAMVRIPNYQLKKVRNVRNTERMLSRELGREADREEISRELRVTIAKIDEILQIKMRELSLDDKVGKDKDTPISDYLVDGRSINPEDELIKHENQGLIRLALRSLNDQEQTVIINRLSVFASWWPASRGSTVRPGPACRASPSTLRRRRRLWWHESSRAVPSRTDSEAPRPGRAGRGARSRHRSSESRFSRAAARVAASVEKPGSAVLSSDSSE